MYPLLLKPPIKDYLWGGTRLKTEFNLECDTAIAAEGWMLSCHKDGTSIVTNGKFASKTLSSVLEEWGGDALGKNAAHFSYFPLLIKLIDAKQSLSVQVHPNDEYALQHEGEFGKTEMWYVVDCDDAAELIYGFNTVLSKDEFEKRIADNTLLDVCNHVPVQKGDVFFIEAGMLHAIGGGILIAEVQQNSNSTYRVYDFGRLGADGKPRTLHTQKAIEVTSLEPPTIPYGQVGDVIKDNKNTIRTLAQCDLFSTHLLMLQESFTVHHDDSFVSLVCLDGSATISWNDSSFRVQKGNSVFIPAGLTVEISGIATLLYSYI